MLTAVILNDTRGHDHFGCHRVMEAIEDNLARRGIAVAARSLVSQRWWTNDRFLSAMQRSDVIVINGEGTLHHGRRHGADLLKVVEHPRRGRIPVALINALYQDNPKDWKRYVDKIDFLAARDSWSAAELGSVAGRAVFNTLDLSLSGAVVESSSRSARDLLVVGESVERNVGKALREIARHRPDAVFLPIMTTIKSSKPQHSGLFYSLRESYIRAHAWLFSISVKNLRFCRSQQEYLEVLERAFMHVTGRFHGVCLSLVTDTPFIGLTSNSWKVEALLNDIGFSQQRLMTGIQVSEFLRDSGRLDFSVEERANIGAALARARQQTAEMFDAIRTLAEGHGPRSNVTS